MGVRCAATLSGSDLTGRYGTIEVKSTADRMPSWSDSSETGLLNDRSQDYGGMGGSIYRSMGLAGRANETQERTHDTLKKDRQKLLAEHAKATQLNVENKEANDHLGKLECQKRWRTVLYACIIMQGVLALALGIYVFS